MSPMSSQTGEIELPSSLEARKQIWPLKTSLAALVQRCPFPSILPPRPIIILSGDSCANQKSNRRGAPKSLLNVRLTPSTPGLSSKS